jgi:hypothetical protein
MCTGVSTQPSDTTIELSLTARLASSILGPPYLASPQVSYLRLVGPRLCTVISHYILEAYGLYVQDTGAVLDETTGLLMISPDRYEKLQSLYLNIGNRTYEFNRNAQIWPRALNSLIGGEKDMVYLIANDLGPDLSKEMGFVAGMTFLERFYVVFDSSQNRVGLANTNFTDLMNIN